MRTRAMTFGIVLCGLFACGHFAGFLEASHAARHDPALAAVTDAMRSHRSNVLGMRPSLLDFREYFSASFSLLMVLVVALNAIALRGAPASTVRRLALADAIAFAILAAVSWWFQVPQGIISGVMIAVVFAAAVLPPNHASDPGANA